MGIKNNYRSHCAGLLFAAVHKKTEKQGNNARHHNQQEKGRNALRLWGPYIILIRPARLMRIANLSNSLNHSTELATSVQSSQSLKLRLTVENAC
jgi:hypothetical protein